MLDESPLVEASVIDPHHPLRTTIDLLIELGESGDVSISHVVGAFGGTGLATAMMIPALLVISPLSGIPIFSSLCGLTIALIALQMLIRRDRLWLPGLLSRRHLNGARLSKALKRTRRVADWLDSHTAPRLRHLTSAPFDTIPKAACLLSGLMMPLLELVPFTSSLLGVAVTMTAIGFMARDGLYVLVAAIFVLLAASVPFSIYTFGIA